MTFTLHLALARRKGVPASKGFHTLHKASYPGEKVTDDDLLSLGSGGYGGHYTADSVAEFMADCDPHVQALFDHNATLPQSIELRGFECHVNEEEAEAWIAKHRSHLLMEEEGA